MCGARRPHRHCRQPLTPPHQNARIKNVHGMNDKEKAALGSIAASAALTAAKAVVGVMTGSLAILSEAAHSLLDFAATVLTYAAVRVSG